MTKIFTISIAFAATLLAAAPATAQDYSGGPTAAIERCNALYRPGDETSVQAQANCLRTVEKISADIARTRTETIRENSRYGQTVVREGARYGTSRHRDGTAIMRDLIGVFGR